MEQMRERVKAAVVSYAFQECQPDKGDIFGWFDDRADEIVDSALSLMQPEIDRRVAEEWARLLERLREPSERMLALGRHAAGYRLPTGVVKNVWQALSAQFEKENSDG